MRPHLFAAALALAVTGTASAADHELSLEWGLLQNADPNFDVFSYGDFMPSRGFRAGVAVHERVAVVGGWHRARRGATLSLPNSSLATAYFADEFTLGGKVDVEPLPFLQAYATVQAMLYRDVIKIDDDPNDRDNPGQVRGTGYAPGGLAMAGVEVRIPQGDAPFTLGAYVEAGYGLVGRHAIGGARTVGGDGSWDNGADLGTMRPGGFVLRTGAGVRF